MAEAMAEAPAEPSAWVKLEPSAEPPDALRDGSWHGLWDELPAAPRAS
jgi:hypothetical protein